ncbi:hypothetical protein CHLRE_02g085600v5 [Chlamydomonas reinhardtii]|uniref:Serine hydrolase domain-containing protein n=1 Tax=Chlamydomonas reinhardtii TaxID=3055 RepID=A0A2K3E0Y3_CHLRE|nr:uncharacterized protein CHLRE_02g085600v5 [Chlamydomonas reinhardtii]PNW86417.1 hypothetical protein CHLRE_02g085600v5 [Chlamydomonas reinhardtii]
MAAVTTTHVDAARRARVLAFHGWRTSASILQQQLKISSLDITINELADITYLDGPHAAKGAPTPDVARFFAPPFVEWWDAVTDPATGVVTYEGAERSLAAIEAELQAAAAAGRPVEALLGFSQGAALAALVLALQECKLRFQSLPPLQCAVLISGSRIRDPTWAGVYGGPSTSNGGTAMTDLHPESAQALLQRPTCHLIGAADPMRGRSEQLALCFQSPLVLQHEQGHVVPRLQPSAREQLKAFLQQHLHATPDAPAYADGKRH